MRIAVASDHAGFSLKEQLKNYLNEQGHDIEDCGAFSDERSDYPDFAKIAALRVSQGKAERVLLVCGSGLGMCIVANRFKGVRAAVLRDENDAKMGRMHNDINVACFGSRVTSLKDAKKLTDVFLSTPFEGDRHTARIAKIDA